MMRNFLNKLFLKQTTIVAYMRYVLLSISILSLFGVVLATGQANGSNGSIAGSAATNALCNVFNTVRNIIFLLGLTLMILGGALYAGATIMPGQSKGAFQGYGMSMIIGGVIGVAIAVAAPFVLNLVVSAGGTSIVSYGGGGSGISGISTLCGGNGAAP
jgi:hypothetical protein